MKQNRLVLAAVVVFATAVVIAVAYATHIRAAGSVEDQDVRQISVPPLTEETRAAIGRDINGFSLDLYSQVRRSAQGNLFFSPFSISSALTMTSGGARGNTLAQMQAGLHLSLPGLQQHQARGALLQELNAVEKNGKPRSYQLAVANRLFGQSDYALSPDFLELHTIHLRRPSGCAGFSRQRRGREPDPSTTGWRRRHSRRSWI